MPVPPENAFNRPEVPPWAEAENVSSPISIVQVPRPTGMPASDASYWASSRPCADAACGASDSKAPATRHTQQPREGEMALKLVTTYDPCDLGPCVRSFI